MRVMLLGYGYWGESWAAFLQESEEFTLTALVERDDSSRRAAQKRWGLADEACFADYDKALAQSDAEIVFIVVAHHLHLPLAQQAVESGRHVLIEKPLCDDLEQAREFAHFMRGRPQRVFVSQNYRYREDLWRIRASLQSEAMGAPAWAEISYRAGMTTDPEEHVWNIQGWRGEQTNMLCVEVCIHHYDMLRFLVGSDIEAVTCVGWLPAWGISGGVESVFLTLEFKSGFKALLSAHSCSVGAPTEFQGIWRVQAEKGLIEWPRAGVLTVAPAAVKPGTLTTSYTLPGYDRGGVLVELGRALAGQPSTLPTLEDNLNSFATAFAALRSAEEGRRVRIDELLV